MTNTEFQDRYAVFMSTNRQAITNELKSRYDKYCSDLSSFWAAFDFGGHVVLPLFVIWSTISISFFRQSSIALVVSSILFVLFALWMRRWWKTLAERTCNYFFYKYEYKEIILLCTNRSRAKDLSKVNSQAESMLIEEFYEQCERYVIDEYFNYN